MAEPPTEARNPRASRLGALSTRELLELMNDEDTRVAPAVRASLPAIERAVDAVVAAFAEGGRLVYVGAGTSGRLGVLDASEMPPTFGVDPDVVQGIIAGGDAALRRSIEGAEDDPESGARAVRERVTARDVLVGISVSGRAPFVVGAVEAARAIGARTVAITGVAASALARAAEIAIVFDAGPEIVAGSSRLKAGTATKLVLNMLSTAAMVRSGHTHGDLMVDLRPTNAKLRERAVRIVRDETGLDEPAARARLEAAGWNVRGVLEAHRQR